MEGFSENNENLLSILQNYLIFWYNKLGERGRRDFKKLPKQKSQPEYINSPCLDSEWTVMKALGATVMLLMLDFSLKIILVFWLDKSNAPCCLFCSFFASLKFYYRPL